MEFGDRTAASSCWKRTTAVADCAPLVAREELQDKLSAPRIRRSRSTRDRYAGSKFWRDVGVQYQELVLRGEVLTALALSCVLSMYLMSVMPPLIALASAIGIVAGASASLWLLFILAASSWFLQVLVLVIASKRSEVSPAYAFYSSTRPKFALCDVV